MSNRAMAHQYMAGSSGRMPTTLGRTSLLDVITGNTPSKLSGQQHQQEMEMQRIIQQHEIDATKLQADLADRLSKSQVINDLARQRGVTPDALANEIAPQLTANALAKAKLEGQSYDPSINPNAQKSANAGANLDLSHIPPQLLTGKAGLGETATSVNMPGTNAPENSTFGNQVISGGLPFQEMGTAAKYTDPKNGMSMFQASPLNKMRPGGVQMPVRPEIKAGALNLGGASGDNNEPQQETSFQPPMFNLGQQQQSNGPIPTTPGGLGVGMPQFNLGNQSQQQTSPNATMMNTLLQALFGNQMGPQQQAPAPFPQSFFP